MHEEYLYKEQLLNSLSRDDQLVDNVKLHLREKIINKLQANKAPGSVPTDPELINKICASLFLDYLSAHRMFHSASVFAPESGISRAGFSNDQLQSLFRLETEGSISILEAVVKQVMPKGRLTEKRVEVAIQTDDKECIQNLENRLNQVEFNFKQKAVTSLKTVQDMETRMLKYKSEMNKRYKQDLQVEIDRIRSIEVTNIRIEEQEKYKMKLQEYMDELENNYRSKMEKLREREAEVIQRVSTKMKEIQTYNYQSRQRLLRDIESVKTREEEIERIKAGLQEKERNMTRNRSQIA